MLKRHSAATKPSAERPAWHFFGGKGGVGKTTCAAAWALAHAERGASVLLLSTDPAHSLGDAFDRRLGAAVRRIPTRSGRLDAVETSSRQIVGRWVDENRRALAGVIERGTLLDGEDVREMLALPIPGLDELAAFLQLGAFDGSGVYDLLVIDTAPTGHTLRLLETPELVEQLGRALEAMDDRDAAVRAAFTGRRRAAPAAIVSELHAQARTVSHVLRDATRCEVRWVTLPEPVTVAETIDGITWLRARAVALKGVIVNRATLPQQVRCSECAARRAFEGEAVAPLARIARGLELRVVPAAPREPRGAAPLRAISAHLLSSASWQIFHTTRPRAKKRPEQGTGTFAGKVPVPCSGARLLVFGGKGGVGKTTCAAAVALAAARAGRHVRLISVDPAPSLAEVLDAPIGDDWRAVAPRLLARELDARRVIDEYKTKYRQAVNDIFDRLRGGSIFDATADRAVFERLFNLAPPGLDEIVALLTVMSLATAGDRDEAEKADLIVVDAAPTGHMVRLLAMPADAQRWVALLMRLMLKYQLAARAESLAADLVTLSRELRELSDLLHDRERSRLVTVTRPAALPRLETARLLRDLRRLKIPAPVLVVNAETTGTCARCTARQRAESREVERLRRFCPAPACVIVHAPLALPPPRGARALLAWAEQWRAQKGDSHTFLRATREKV